MYLDFLVKIPEAKGKLLYEKRGGAVYIVVSASKDSVV